MGVVSKNQRQKRLNQYEKYKTNIQNTKQKRFMGVHLYTYTLRVSHTAA